MDIFARMLSNKEFPQILQLDAGDNLELKMIEGDNVSAITLNIELVA